MVREHRRVENTEDFTQWDWGKWEGPSDELGELERTLFAQLKEWVSYAADQIHEKSCAIGAQIAFEELAENGFFALEGITDRGLLICFQGPDGFCIYDELLIVDETIDVEDLQHYPAHLRRLADEIDAICQKEQSPSKPSA